MITASHRSAAKHAAQAALRQAIPADATIYGIRSTNRAGTVSRVRLFVVRDNCIEEWTTTISVALDMVDLRGSSSGIRVTVRDADPLHYLVQQVARVVFDNNCNLKGARL